MDDTISRKLSDRCSIALKSAVELTQQDMKGEQYDKPLVAFHKIIKDVIIYLI